MSKKIIVEIPQEILDSARLTASELRVELAISLYTQGKLSVGKARELAGLSLWEFRQLLSSRRIPVHYDIEDLNEDIALLRKQVIYDGPDVIRTDYFES